MPLYEYHCRSCRARVELLVTVSTDTRSLECPQCGARELEKQFSTFATATGSRSVGEPCGSAGCPRASGFT